MDDSGRYEYWYLGCLQEWGQKVSGLSELKIFQVMHLPNYLWADAWCYPKNQYIFLNGEMLREYPIVYWGWIKAVILHEIGHIFHIKRRGSAREYKAHEWAMQKCCKFGMETQLWYLREMALHFNDTKVQHMYGDKRFYRVYKWFKRKSII